jgi:predicted nucleic acid-binding protein
MGQEIQFMKKPLLVDTDVLIDFLRGNEEAIEYVRTNSNNIILSSITVSEIYAGVRGNKELDDLDEFISLFSVFQVTSEIAKAGGLYKRDYYKSHGVGLADAIIAATAKIQNTRLITFNINHFPMLSDVMIPYKK